MIRFPHPLPRRRARRPESPLGAAADRRRQRRDVRTERAVAPGRSRPGGSVRRTVLTQRTSMASITPRTQGGKLRGPWPLGRRALARQLGVAMRGLLVVGLLSVASVSHGQSKESPEISLGEREKAQMYCVTQYSRGLAQQIRVSASWPASGYTGLGVHLRLSCKNASDVGDGEAPWFVANSWPAWLGRSDLEVGIAPSSVCLVDLSNMGSPTRVTTTVTGNLECTERER